MFLSTIAYDKKKLKGFLYTTIKSDKDYTWLFNLLHHLGNNGTILLLNIYEYQNILKSKTLSLSSPLNKIISDLRIVQNLNKHEIYFLDDLVKYDEQSLKDLEGIGLKTVETVKEELSKTNFHLGMQPLNYHEIEHIKTNNNKTDEVKYNARKISRLLDKNYTLYDVVVYSNDIAKYITYDLGLDATIPDNQIVGIASYIQTINGKDVIFVTNDICL